MSVRAMLQFANDIPQRPVNMLCQPSITKETPDESSPLAPYVIFDRSYEYVKVRLTTLYGV